METAWPRLVENQRDSLGDQTMVSLLSLCLSSQTGGPSPAISGGKGINISSFRLPILPRKLGETHSFPIMDIRYFGRR